MAAVESKLSELSETLEQLQMPTTPIDVGLILLNVLRYQAQSLAIYL